MIRRLTTTVVATLATAALLYLPGPARAQGDVALKIKTLEHIGLFEIDAEYRGGDVVWHRLHFEIRSCRAWPIEPVLVDCNWRLHEMFLPKNRFFECPFGTESLERLLGALPFFQREAPHGSRSLTVADGPHSVPARLFDTSSDLVCWYLTTDATGQEARLAAEIRPQWVR